MLFYIYNVLKVFFFLNDAISEPPLKKIRIKKVSITVAKRSINLTQKISFKQRL